jgi:chromosome segregation ATPase
MNLVIDELRRTQKYHLRQLEENINKIKFHEEAIETLKNGIEQHRETLQQIREALEILEKDIVSPMPIKKESTDIITEVG